MVSHDAAGPPKRSIVDLNALKTNQTLIVGLVVVAFILGREVGAWVVAAVALSLAIGAARPGSGPFQLLYRRLLVRRGVVNPRLAPGDAAPHRFAQLLGATFLGVAAIALWGGIPAVGWVFAWIVVVLALVNLLFGFCAGCFVYLHLGRLRRRAAQPA